MLQIISVIQFFVILAVHVAAKFVYEF
jgi:hypothetical protein